MTTLSQNFEELTLEVSCQEHGELEERFHVPESKDKNSLNPSDTCINLLNLTSKNQESKEI